MVNWIATKFRAKLGRRKSMATAFKVANLFELAGSDISVTYSSSSLAGGPQLNYRDRDTNRTFSNDEIERGDTPVGELITVGLRAEPDRLTVSFSLILPTVNILPGSAGAAITVPALVTTSHTSLAGPVLGPQKTYHVLTMQGTGQFVQS
jgi:hypothetical protein